MNIIILSEKVSLDVKEMKSFLFLVRLIKLLYIFIYSDFMKNIFFIPFFFLITNCSLNLVDDHHGVFFLDKKEEKIIVNNTNKNDILNILGEPSTISSFDNDMWIYIERKITNSHFFGKRKLIVNNVLILEIDEKGLVAKKKFIDINKMNDISFDQNRTVSLEKRDFVYKFLSSLRQKVNDPMGVRKKRREEGLR